MSILIGILITPHPSVGFKLVDETGLLEYILPGLLKLKGVESVDGEGYKEIFSHTLQIVDNVAVIYERVILIFSPVEVQLTLHRRLFRLITLLESQNDFLMIGRLKM